MSQGHHFDCKGCKKHIYSETSEEEMQQEYIDLFGMKPIPEESGMVCDDCYVRILADARAKGILLK